MTIAGLPESLTDKVTFRSITGLINGYYDFKNSSKFTPYLGVGVGAGEVVMNNEIRKIEKSGVGFAYQVGTWIDYSINEKIAIGLKYRYFSMPDIKFNDAYGPVTMDYSSHTLYAGVRFYF